jgi:CheY-like chemotaxis protein
MLKMRHELTDEFAVLVAEDGEKGCAMAAAELSDLILILEMPVVDGWEAARRLKGNPATRHIPIIGLSAHALAGEREKALAAGCEEFDTKPVEFERLLGNIRRLLKAAGSDDAALRAGRSAALRDATSPVPSARRANNAYRSECRAGSSTSVDCR